ncbi:unnamed protein product, partial [Pylaiella littoralis]
EGGGLFVYYDSYEVFGSYLVHRDVCCCRLFFETSCLLLPSSARIDASLCWVVRISGRTAQHINFALIAGVICCSLLFKIVPHGFSQPPVGNWRGSSGTAACSGLTLNQGVV